MASASEAGGGLIGSLLGGILGQNGQDWYKNSLITILNNLNSANSFGLKYGQDQFNPASTSAQHLLDLAPQMLFNGDFGSMNTLQNSVQGSLGNLNPSQFQQSATSPEMQQILQLLGGVSGGLNGSQGLMSNVVQNGGGSQQSQDIWDSLKNLSSGNGANNNAQSDAAFKLLTNPQSSFTNTAKDVGQGVLQNGGMTNSLQSALSALMGISNAGGSNANMDAGMQTALGLLSGQSPLLSQMGQAGMQGLQSNLGTAGLTQTGAAGEKTALQGLQNNGANPTTDFFTQRGAQLAGQDAVLPTLLATSMARDEATNQNKNAAEAARTQALSHGGGPGALVANGTTNSALTDFADKGAQNISSAVGDTLQKQQALGLQQQSNGAQMGLGGGQIQSNNLGKYGDLLSSLENNAVNRYGTAGSLLGGAQSGQTAQTALGLQGVQGLSGLQSNNILQALSQIPGLENSATNKAGTFGNLGLGAGQLDNANQALGGSLNNSGNNTLLQALQGLQGNVNQANNYSLGAAGTQNSMAGTQGNILNSIFGNQLGGSQLGMNQQNSFQQALSSLLGGQQNLVNSQLGMYGTAYNPLMNIGNQAFGHANTAVGGMPNIFNPASANSPMAGGVAGAAGSLGDLLKGVFKF